MFFTFFIPGTTMIEGDENMRKVIPSFVMCLIFSIIGAICAYLFSVVFVIAGAFVGGIFKTLSTTIPFINMATFGLSFIATFFCFKQPKFAGILMIISSILSLICFVIMCVALKSIDIITICFWLPTLFILIAGILSLKASRKRNQPIQ